MNADDEIAEFFRQAAIIQSVVHTGRHPDCPCEDGRCIYPDCTCALPSTVHQGGDNPPSAHSSHHGVSK